MPDIIPPVYTREIRLFGLLIWSDRRQLDEEALFNKISARINEELAKEIIALKALKK